MTFSKALATIATSGGMVGAFYLILQTDKLGAGTAIVTLLMWAGILNDVWKCPDKKKKDKEEGKGRFINIEHTDKNGIKKSVRI